MEKSKADIINYCIGKMDFHWFLSSILDYYVHNQEVSLAILLTRLFFSFLLGTMMGLSFTAVFLLRFTL